MDAPGARASAAAGLRSEDGTAERPLGCGDEKIRPPQCFREYGDHPGCLVLYGIVDDVADREDGLVAGTDQHAQTYRLLVRIIEQHACHGSALGEQGY